MEMVLRWEMRSRMLFSPTQQRIKNVALAQTNNQVWFDFKKTSDNYYHISASNSFKNGECFVEADNYNIVGGNTMSFTTKQKWGNDTALTRLSFEHRFWMEFQPANDVSIEKH